MKQISDVISSLAGHSVKKVKYTINITILILVVIAFGIYTGNILFGSRSLDVMLDLQQEKEIIVKKIDKLKNENAYLQKEYFELRQLDPDIN